MRQLDYLDFAKGIGIILVVMGHTMFPLHSAIDIFHMPLFFFIAGMTLRKYDDFTSFFLKKINRIIIPYFFFAVFWTILNFFYPLLLGDYVGPLWFLPTLFNTLLLCQALFRIPQKYTIGILLSCVIITFFINRYRVTLFPFDLDRVLRAILYVYIGYMFAQSKFRRKLLECKGKTVWGGLVVFSLIYVIGLYVMVITGLKREDEGFMLGQPYGRSIVLLYITSFSAIIATLCFSSIVSSINALKFVNWLGRNSLVILCVHFPFTQYWNIFVSSTAMYESMEGKMMLAVLSWVVILVFCIPWILLSKKYLPKLTGYTILFNYNKGF